MTDMGGYGLSRLWLREHLHSTPEALIRLCKSVVLLVTALYFIPGVEAEDIFVEEPGTVSGILGESLLIPCTTNIDFDLGFWALADGTYFAVIGSNPQVYSNYQQQYRLHGTGPRDFTLMIKNVSLNEAQVRCEVKVGPPAAFEKSTESQIIVIAPPYPGYPRCPTSPNDAVADQSLTLVCESKGGLPAATLQWKDEDGVIDDDVTATDGTENERGWAKLEHTFTVTREDHQRQFTCTAENTAITLLYERGDLSEDHLKCETSLNVQFPPVVRVGPAKPYIVIENLPARLDCTVVETNPSASGFRFKADSQSWSSWTSDQSYEVFSQTPRGSHTGKCKAMNSPAGEGAVDELNIVVHYPPDITISTTSSDDDDVGSIHNIREENNLDLRCLVDALPEAHSIEWTRDGDPAPQNGNSLTIDQIKRTDAGSYMCTAMNQMKPTDPPSPVDKSASKTVTVVVQYVPDDAETEHKILAVKAGDDITLNCTSTDLGVPEGHFQWERDGSSVGGGSGGNGDDGHYKITDASVEDDDGVYLCTPTNSIGSGEAETITLEVRVEPQEEDEVEYVEVLNTKDLTMMCSFKAKPGATIVWKYSNDTNLPDNIFTDVTDTELDGKYTKTKSTLSWNAESDPEDRRHSGGQIKCVAENVAGTKESHGTLNVEFIPYVIKTTPDTKKKGAAKGDSVTLSLEVDANPLTRDQDFTWRFDDSAEEIWGDEFDVLNTDTSSSLTIVNITEDHFGKYQVRVYNKHGDLLDDDGSDGVTFEVTPSSKPDKPRNLILTPTAATLTIEWDRGFDGGKEQTFYLSVNGNFHEQTVSDDPDGNGHYTVKLDEDDGIRESTTYTVSLFAKNDIGDSDTVTKTTNTKAKPLVDTDGTVIHIDKDSNDNPVAIITWSVNNPDSLTHIVVKVCVVNTDDCLQHEIRDVLSTSTVNIPEGQDYEFSFYMYDGSELVASQERAITTGSDDGGGGGLNMGIVGGVVGVIIVLVVVIVVLVILIRRKRAQKGTDPERNDKGPLAKKKKKQKTDTSFDNHGMAMTVIDPYATATSNDRNGVSAPPNGAGAEPAYADVEVKNKKKSKMPLYSLPNIAKKKKVPTATLR